jgi:hypothetical protein
MPRLDTFSHTAYYFPFPQHEFNPKNRNIKVRSTRFPQENWLFLLRQSLFSALACSQIQVGALFFDGFRRVWAGVCVRAKPTSPYIWIQT